MKKLIFIMLAIMSLSANAQKKEKIKGNREVLIKKFTIAPFSAIEVGEKFKVKLQKATDTTRVIIEADDNLFDVIHFNVEDDVLKFWTTMEIVKKKRLSVTVFVPEQFNKIKLVEKGQVFNDEQLELKKLSMETYSKSEAKLNLNIIDDFELTATDKSDIELEVTAPKAVVKMLENADLKAVVTIKSVSVEVNKSANCELEGNIDQLVLKAGQKSKVKAEKLMAKEVNLSAFDKANIYINVSKQIIMNLSGKTETYLYGSPEIKLKSFEGNAVLYKK